MLSISLPMSRGLSLYSCRSGIGDDGFRVKILLFLLLKRGRYTSCGWFGLFIFFQMLYRLFRFC